ncbi:unnamed protein product [Rhizopus stolonifer]
MHLDSLFLPDQKHKSKRQWTNETPQTQTTQNPFSINSFSSDELLETTENHLHARITFTHFLLKKPILQFSRQTTQNPFSIDSFSSDELLETTGNHLHPEDYIYTFSSQETDLQFSRQNFKKNQDKNKRRKILNESREENLVNDELLNDPLFTGENSFDIRSPDIKTLGSPIDDFSSEEEETQRSRRPPISQGSQVPNFTGISRPTVPLPKIPEYLRRSHVERNHKKFIEFKKGGVAERALAVEIKQKEDFIIWENGVNAMMAKYGSIIKVCNKSPESQAFRLIDPWVERGLVFSWCVSLKESEIVQVVGPMTPGNSQISWNEDTQDIIEDFSQPKPLPPYEPEENEERFLIAFSFAYIATTVSKDMFVKNERCVGVWPPWTESEIDSI